MMKLSLFCLTICFLTACELSNPIEDTPALIEIRDITVDGNHTQQISDAWVYVDSEFLGIFPLPAYLPVLKSGSKIIIIDAGIKKNGISASREKYPFFTSFQIDTILESGKSIQLVPQVNYSINNFPFEENFENVGTKLMISSDSLNHEIQKIYDNSNSAFGNYYGMVEIDGLDGEIFECTTNDLNLASDKVTYLEMDYKCNSTLVVGFYVNFANQVNKTSIMYLNPKENWNKIYISLSETISNYANAQSFKLFFGMARDTSLEKNTFSLDNIRLVYEE